MAAVPPARQLPLARQAQAMAELPGACLSLAVAAPCLTGVAGAASLAIQGGGVGAAGGQGPNLASSSLAALLLCSSHCPAAALLPSLARRAVLRLRQPLNGSMRPAFRLGGSPDSVSCQLRHTSGRHLMPW